MALVCMNNAIPWVQTPAEVWMQDMEQGKGFFHGVEHVSQWGAIKEE